VVVPDHAPETKLAAIERLGGKVVKVPYERWWEARRQWGQLIAEARGLMRDSIALLPNDPAQAREMAAFHLNALLRCIIQSHTEEPVVGEVARNIGAGGIIGRRFPCAHLQNGDGCGPGEKRNSVIHRARRLTAVIPDDEDSAADRLEAANIGDNQDRPTRGHQNVFDQLPALRRWRMVRVGPHAAGATDVRPSSCSRGRTPPASITN